MPIDLLQVKKTGGAVLVPTLEATYAVFAA